MEHNKGLHVDELYIPVIVEDKMINALILLILPALLYTLAVYFHLYVKGITLKWAIILGVMIGIIEYIVRIPIVRYTSNVAKVPKYVSIIFWTSLTVSMSLVLDMMLEKDSLVFGFS